MNPAAFIVDVIAGIAVLYALRRIWSTPTWLWAHGRWSQLAWTLIDIWLNVTSGHIMWPVGAALAIRHTAKLGRRPLPGPPPLPHAAGEDATSWWNVAPAPATSKHDPQTGFSGTAEEAAVQMGTCFTCGHEDDDLTRDNPLSETDETDPSLSDLNPHAVHPDNRDGPAPRLRLVADPDLPEDCK